MCVLVPSHIEIMFSSQIQLKSPELLTFFTKLKLEKRKLIYRQVMGSTYPNIWNNVVWFRVVLLMEL